LFDLQTIIAFVPLLAIMIVVHELGHFWAAVAVGIRVETFSIGFGPRLFGFRRGDTDFRLSLIPLGGYVRMLGDQPGDENAVDPASFQAKARWQRAIVIMAGPLMNIVLAVVIVTGLFMYKFPKVDESGPAVITEIEKGSAAEQAGLQVGDRILKFGTQTNPKWEYLSNQEKLNGNHAMDVVVQRNGQRLNLSVTPRIDPKEGVGTIGWDYLNIEVGEIEPNSPAQTAGLKAGDIFVSMNGQDVAATSVVQDAVAHSGGKPIDVQIKRAGQMQHLSVTPIKMGNGRYHIGVSYGEVLPFPVEIVKLSFPEALTQSVRKNYEDTSLIFQTLGSILQRRVSAKSMTGPVGLARNSREAAKRGPYEYLGFMSFVSLNLAIFNLLPIPILDGGTLLLLLIEMLLQREVSMSIKETFLKLGFVLLMMVVVFVLYNDLTRS
jgi:regulator of sigma E protease